MACMRVRVRVCMYVPAAASKCPELHAGQSESSPKARTTQGRSPLEGPQAMQRLEGKEGLAQFTEV